MGLCAALALIVLGQAVTLTPGSDEVTLTADQLRYHTDTQVVEADGNAVLQGQGITIRARHMTYDVRAHVAEGDDARILRDETVGIADHVRVELDSQDVTLERGLFLQKKGTPLDALLAAQSPTDLVEAGKNQLALRGTRIRKVSEDELQVEHLSFTPCDCNPAHPSWRIDSRRADVKVGKSVFLSWPVIYVHGVPVLAFPALDLPLTDRRSGLLIPKPGVTSQNGFSIEQPFFLTLGESYDLTFTPGYFFGADGLAGVRGPRLETDFRYAPVPGMRGEWSLSLLDDFKQPRYPEAGGVARPGSRGLRWSLGGVHTQDLGHGFQDRVDLSLVSDGFLATDLSTDLLARTNRYLRSDAAVFQRADDRYLGVALGYRQDLRYGFDLFETARTQAGLAGPRTLQELPDAVAAFPERTLLGPWVGALDLRFTRLSPLVGRFGDEGEEGVYALVDGNTGVGDRLYEPGERVARDRLDLQPRLSAQWSVGRFFTLTPTLALRQDLYVPELGGGTEQRGHAWADLRLDSRLARTFGGPDGLTHAIEPSVELRYAPGGWGTPLGPEVGSLGAGLRPYDEIDLSMPDEGITQLVAQVSQKLVRRSGLATQELLRLDLGEELDLRAAHPPRDAFARLGTSLGTLHLLGLARYDVLGRRLAQLSASGTVSLGERASVHAVYDDLLFGGSALQRRGLDTLIGSPYAAGPVDRVQLITAGSAVQLFGGLGLRYDVSLQPTAEQALAQQTLGVSYAPACDCWRLEVFMQATRNNTTNDPFGSFRLGGGLTISHFGTIGTGG